MKILAFESSALVAGIALAEDENLIAEYTLNHLKTHSQTLLPMLDEITKMTGLQLDELDAFAVAEGPGSFTGLRIGAATVKGLALATNKPIVPVSTIEAMAYNFYGSDKLICPLMDARRGQVYTGIFAFEEKQEKIITYERQTIMETSPMAIEEVADKLNSLNRKVIFLGDGVPVHEEYLKEHIKCGMQFANAGSNRQKASGVAMLGLELLKAGKTTTAADFVPVYYRASQAERERMEKS